MRILALDGVRGIAILWVIAAHYYGMKPKTAEFDFLEPVNVFLSYGHMGVGLFFVLSGFLIGRILTQKRGSPRYFRAFFTRRFFRLYPVLVLLLAAYFLLGKQYPGSQDGNNIIPVWSIPLFLQNIFMTIHGYLGNDWLRVTWSLAVEEQFYIFSALLIYYLSPNRLAWAVMGCVAGSVALRYVLMFGMETPTALMVLTPCRLDSFGIGMLVAIWLNREDRPEPKLWHPILVAALACLYTHAVCSGKLGDINQLLVPTYYTSASLAFGALLVLCLMSRKNPVQGFCENAFLRKTGQISYFMYLFHMPMMILVFRLFTGKYPQHVDPDTLIIHGVAFGAVFLLGILSYEFMEKHMITLGRRVAY